MNPIIPRIGTWQMMKLSFIYLKDVEVVAGLHSVACCCCFCCYCCCFCCCLETDFQQPVMKITQLCVSATTESAKYFISLSSSFLKQTTSKKFFLSITQKLKKKLVRSVFITLRIYSGS